MVNSRKHAAIAVGLLGNFALGVGGCSGSASLGGGSSSVGGGQSGGVAATGGMTGAGGSTPVGGSHAGTGGASGGSLGTGGSSGVGGGTAATGGSIGSGGSAATGGVSASGGSLSTGGKPSTGGSSSATGGKPSTGGTSGATGGAVPTGGSLASGGTSQISTGIYDSCAGKNCGDTCTLCAPGDPNCSEVAILRSCDLKGNCIPGTVDCSTADVYTGCMDVADPDDFLIVTKATAKGMCVTLWLVDYTFTSTFGLAVPKGWTTYLTASWPASTAPCAVATTAAPVSASHATVGTGTVTFNGSPWSSALTVNIDAVLTFPQGDAGITDPEAMQVTALPAGGPCR